MEKIKEVVFDAGPFIHLNEINKLDLLSLFLVIFTTREILEECKKIRDFLQHFKNIIQKELESKSKNFAKYLIEEYDIDIGEASGIALCRQEKIKLFFTDDLSARETANILGFESHGTIAIVLRSYREKLIIKEEAKKALENLYRNSTLFFTKDLFDFALKEINNYKK